MAGRDWTEYTMEEMGLPLPSPRAPTRDGQPRGNAIFPTAHPSHYSGLFSAGNRSYYQWFDNALKHGRTNSHRILNDPVVYSSMRLRSTAVSLLTQHAQPDDDTDEDEVKAAKTYDRMKKRFRGYFGMRRWLLYNGVFKGKSAAYSRWEKRWDKREGRTFENPTDLTKVLIDGDKLAFRWNGEVGITVGAGFKGPTDFVAGFGRVYFYTPEELDQLVLFEFEHEDAEFFNPEQAGLIHGAGLRHRLYWLWALKSQLWAASIDFLEWWARGILIFYFEHGNDAHLQSVSEWVEKFDGQWQRLFPRMKDGGPGYKPIERIEPNVSTNSFLQELITSYLDDLIRQIIIGQTLTTKASPTGLGSAVAEAHENTFEQIVKYDALYFDECETYTLAKPWYESNYPGMPHARIVSEVDSPNVQQLMDAAHEIYEMGGNVPEDPLLEAAGLPETKEGDTILTQVQPMQPAAVGGMPEGVPQMEAQPADGQEQPPVDQAPPGPQQQSAVRMYRERDLKRIVVAREEWVGILKRARSDRRYAKMARQLYGRIRIV